MVSGKTYKMFFESDMIFYKKMILFLLQTCTLEDESPFKIKYVLIVLLIKAILCVTSIHNKNSERKLSDDQKSKQIVIKPSIHYNYIVARIVDMLEKNKNYQICSI